MDDGDERACVRSYKKLQTSHFSRTKKNDAAELFSFSTGEVFLMKLMFSS